MHTHKSIYQIYGDIKCFWQQFKFRMDTNDPVNQYCSYIFIYFCLSFHVWMVRLSVFFILLHVVLNLSTILWDVINITKCSSINVGDFTRYVSFNSLIMHGYFCTQTNLRQFFTGSNCCSGFSWYRLARNKLSLLEFNRV